MLSNITKLFGSDIYTEYTANYTWKCNQTAHMAFGFVGATLVSLAASRLGGDAWWGLAFLIVPILKDSTDYVVDKERASKLRDNDPENMRFALPKGELSGDAVTDFLFWTAGCLLAVLIGLLASPMPLDFSPDSGSTWTKGRVILVAVLIGLGLVLYFLPWRLYVRAKQKFDESRLPIYFRLPSFRGRFESEEDFQEVKAFSDGQPKVRHLLISGELRSGKTTLAAGIGCRLTIPVGFRVTESEIESRGLRYITASNLFEEMEAYQNEVERQGRPGAARTDQRPNAWHLDSAQILIVDDVILAELFDKDRLHYQKEPHSGIGTPVPTREGYQAAFEALDDKRILWVVADPAQLEKWKYWVERNFTSNSPEELSRMLRLASCGSHGPAAQVEPAPGTLARRLAVATILVALALLIGALLVILQADRLGALWFWALYLGSVAGIFLLVADSREDGAANGASNR